MKPLTTVSAIAALLCSSSVFAANLTIPMSFQYLALDGVKVETTRFNHKEDLALKAGQHKVAIRYNDVYEDNFSDSPNFVKSSPFILTFDIDSNGSYLLKAVKTGASPEEYAKSPQVVLQDKEGHSVDFDIKHTNIEESSFLGRLFNAGSQETNVNVAAAAVTAGKPVPQPVKQVSAIEQATQENAVSSDQTSQMLQYWWQQADEKTRKEFMSWAIKQL